MNRLIRLAAQSELALLVLITPALLFPTPLRLAVLAPVPLVWLAIRLRDGRWLPPTPANVAVLVLATTTAVSLFLTPDVMFSLDKVAGMVLGVLTFFALVRHLDTPPRVALAVVLFALAGGALALVGLLGTQWIDKFPAAAAVTERLPPLIRGVRGAETGFHPNAVAGALVLFVPLQATLIALAVRARQTPAPTSGSISLIARTPVAVAIAATFAICAITLFLTQSRGAMAGLAGATVTALLAGGRRARMLGAALAVAAVIVTVMIGPASLVRQLNTPINTKMGDIPGRVELWTRAIYAIEDAPLGVGMNIFRRMRPHRYPTFPAEPEWDFSHAHNQFLQTAVDLGLPGLMAFLALCGLSFAMIWRTRHEPGWGAVATGLGVGLFAHLGFGLFDAIPLGAKVGITFWWTVALIVSAHAITMRGDRLTAPHSSAPINREDVVRDRATASATR